MTINTSLLGAPGPSTVRTSDLSKGAAIMLISAMCPPPLCAPHVVCCLAMLASRALVADTAIIHVARITQIVRMRPRHSARSDDNECKTCVGVPQRVRAQTCDLAVGCGARGLWPVPLLLSKPLCNFKLLSRSIVVGSPLSRRRLIFVPRAQQRNRQRHLTASLRVMFVWCVCVPRRNWWNGAGHVSSDLHPFGAMFGAAWPRAHCNCSAPVLCSSDLR